MRGLYFLSCNLFLARRHLTAYGQQRGCSQALEYAHEIFSIADDISALAPVISARGTPRRRAIQYSSSTISAAMHAEQFLGSEGISSDFEAES